MQGVCFWMPRFWEFEQTVWELQQEKDLEEAMQSCQLMKWKDRASFQVELENLQGWQVKEEEVKDASHAKWTAQVK
jgi:hypothetical protein